MLVFHNTHAWKGECTEILHTSNKSHEDPERKLSLDNASKLSTEAEKQ
jgi:hypothetical protein